MSKSNVKKVAVFLPSLRGGGAERAMVLLANEIARRDIVVDLLVGKLEGPYLETVSKCVTVVSLDVDRVLYAIPKLARYLQNEKPCGMISALYHANLCAVIAKHLSCGDCKLVVSEQNTIDGTPADNVRDYFARSFIGFVYRGADSVVGVSKGVAADLMRRGVPSELVRVVFNPIDVHAIENSSGVKCCHPWLNAQDVPVILAVGRLEAQKDFSLLLRAFARVRKEKAARLLVLGEGSLRGALLALSKSLGVADDVQLVGFVDNPYSYMQKSRVFAVSSRWEGFGNVVAEALTCGVPVVSTDCVGPAEILEGGKWGRLVPVGDVEKLALAIIATLDKPIDVCWLKERGREFTPKNSADQYLALLAK